MTPQGKQNKIRETWKYETIKQETGECDTGVEERQTRGSEATQRSMRERERRDELDMTDWENWIKME